MSRLCAEDENTEAQRTQSFPSRLSSVISVPLCFKSEKLQAAIRDNMQKLGFALPEVGE